jgi:hypothetical protein
MNDTTQVLEVADREHVWTDAALDLAARADLATEALRREERVTDAESVRITGEEALLWVLTGDTPSALEAELAERRERVMRNVVGVLPGEVVRTEEERAEERAERSRERARARYHEDEAYRERCKAEARRRRDSDEFRARERERKRKARARAKQAKS